MSGVSLGTLSSSCTLSLTRGAAMLSPHVPDGDPGTRGARGGLRASTVGPGLLPFGPELRRPRSPVWCINLQPWAHSRGGAALET